MTSPKTMKTSARLKVASQAFNASLDHPEDPRAALVAALDYAHMAGFASADLGVNTERVMASTVHIVDSFYTKRLEAAVLITVQTIASAIEAGVGEAAVATMLAALQGHSEPETTPSKPNLRVIRGGS